MLPPCYLLLFDKFLLANMLCCFACITKSIDLSLSLCYNYNVTYWLSQEEFLFLGKGGEIMSNLDVRQAISESGLKHWELASMLGIGESTLCKKLRFELSDEEKARIYKVISENKKAAH